MEMTLPSNYVEIAEDEMMYLDGGINWSTLGKSLKNLYNRFSFAAKALKGSGLTLGVIATIGKGAATYLYSKIAVTLGSIAAANWVVGIVIGVSAAAAIWAMQKWVCF